MPTGLALIQFRDLYRADWTLDWDNATLTTFKLALFGAKTIDFSAALLYNTTPLNTGEQAGTGYTAGGAGIPGRTVVDIGTLTLAFTATYVEWNPVTTTTVRTAVAYKTADSKVVGVWDLGTPADVTAGVFRITWANDRAVTHKLP